MSNQQVAIELLKASGVLSQSKKLALNTKGKDDAAADIVEMYYAVLKQLEDQGR